MKVFMYCENTDGGMEYFITPGAAGLEVLYGWMRAECAVADKMLSLWMAGAEVGDFYEHRLGVCIRIKDAT